MGMKRIESCAYTLRMQRKPKIPLLASSIASTTEVIT